MIAAPDFLDTIRCRMREQPDAVFCWFIAGAASRPITWGTFGRDVSRFAAAYRHRGLVPGGVVPIVLRHDPALYSSFFAAMLCGLVPSFLACPSLRQDPGIYWPSLRDLLTHLDPAAIVLRRDSLDAMRAAGLDIAPSRVVLVEDVPSEGAIPTPPPDAGSPLLLQHSSGTTGRRKGVALGERAVTAQLRAYGAALGLQGDDRIVSWLPLYHDMGLMACLLLPAYFGVPFVHLDAFRWVARPALLFEAIETYRGTLAWQPNFAFEHLVNSVRGGACHDLSSMRAFINCSEPCRPESMARFAARFASCGVRPELLQSCYAMAETVFSVSQTALGSRPRAIPLGDPPRPTMALGRPIDGIEVSVRGRDGRALPAGAVGEIALRGEFLFEGYFRDPDTTARRFHSGWYMSRDLGAIIDGDIHVIGRADDMLIINGRNIHAGEVEALIDDLGCTQPGRVVVFGLYDERIGANVLVIVAERRRPSPLSDAAIVDCVAEHVRSTIDIQPRDVCFVPRGWIIKTTSGKVARNANRQKYCDTMMTTKETALAGA